MVEKKEKKEKKENNGIDFTKVKKFFVEKPLEELAYFFYNPQEFFKSYFYKKSLYPYFVKLNT